VAPFGLVAARVAAAAEKKVSRPGGAHGGRGTVEAGTASIRLEEQEQESQDMAWSRTQADEETVAELEAAG
jgi:hypothetical protein